MSAERAAIGGLLRQVALYRLTLGQPDPERLLDALNAGGAIDERLARKLVLDLTPPPSTRDASTDKSDSRR